MVLLALSLLVLLSSGCNQKISSLLSIYKVDVNQGNLLKVESIQKIKQGMNKKQVEFIMGPPIITPLLNPDQWHYVHIKTNKKNQIHQKVSLLFSKDKLIKIDSTVED
ncbi:MAG: outer membrane protein assembly factor BamE [Endozoicomonadaceae bacterium]|nr:outer membrane protein assembly factor BamE [Endozoicomonadaceae bacterium]